MFCIIAMHLEEKGHQYEADSPIDLYNRMKLTIDLKDEINAELPEERHIAIFSFPMRYIPLTDNKRGYVGEKWNTKYLRAIQRMLIPTQGKGVSSRSFFEADFGKDSEEFMEILAMPEDIIANRGRFEEKKGESITERQKRLAKWEENNEFLKEWRRLFYNLSNKKDYFIEHISDNVFSKDKFFMTNDSEIKKLLLLYFSENQFLELLTAVSESEDVILIYDYSVNEFPIFLKRVVDYIYDRKCIPASKLTGFLRVFGKIGIKGILQRCIEDGFENEGILESLDIAQLKEKINLFNITILLTYKNYLKHNCFTVSEKKLAERYILDLDFHRVLNLLQKKSKKFKSALAKSVSGELGSDELMNQIDILTSELFRRLSLY